LLRRHECQAFRVYQQLEQNYFWNEEEMEIKCMLENLQAVCYLFICLVYFFEVLRPIANDEFEIMVDNLQIIHYNVITG
jgi:hypothetical protein